MGKVAFDPKLGREFFVLGIFSPVVQRERLASLGWQFLESANDCSVGLGSALSLKLGNQNKTALALDQAI